MIVRYIVCFRGGAGRVEFFIIIIVRFLGWGFRVGKWDKSNIGSRNLIFKI